MIKNLELLYRLLKSISFNEYRLELVVFVKVSSDNLKDSSKVKSSKTRMLDKINKLMKKEINIKNANFTFSLFSLIWEDKIFWFTILLGLASLKISINVAFNSMYILKNFIPEVLEIIDPPIIVRRRKYNEKLPSILFIMIPEVDKLLNVFIKASKKL